MNYNIGIYRQLVSKSLTKTLCKLGIELELYQGSKRSEYITYNHVKYKIPSAEEVSGCLRYEYGIECMVSYNENNGYLRYEPCVYINGKRVNDCYDMFDDYDHCLMNSIEYGVYYLYEYYEEIEKKECVSYSIDIK